MAQKDCLMLRPLSRPQTIPNPQTQRRTPSTKASSWVSVALGQWSYMWIWAHILKADSCAMSSSDRCNSKSFPRGAKAKATECKAHVLSNGKPRLLSPIHGTHRSFCGVVLPDLGREQSSMRSLCRNGLAKPGAGAVWTLALGVNICPLGSIDWTCSWCMC